MLAGAAYAVIPVPRILKQEDEVEIKTSKSNNNKELLAKYYSTRFLGFCFYF